MSEALRRALAELRTTRAEIDALRDRIRTMTVLARPEQFPRIPRRRGEDDDDDDGPALRPTLAPREVAERWSARRDAWLRSLRARDLSAVVAALADPTVGPRLAGDVSFVQTLVPLLRTRKQRRAVTLLAAQRYPPVPAVAATAARLRAADRARTPDWWDSLVQPPELAARLARAVAGAGWPDVRERHRLPQAFSASGWADAVVDHARASTVDELERLLRFVDGGEELSTPTPLRRAHVPLVQQLVATGTRSATERVRIAALLRRRVGDVFGVADEVRWRGLEAERRTVRSWVAAEVLDILFRNLVPSGMGSHQTEPRRRFWRRYTHRVDRLWLLVHDRLEHRLERPEVRELLEKVGPMVDVRELRGGMEQAVVWMHLRSDRGDVITVIEGNANTTCRVSPGVRLPPARGVVEYSRDIVRVVGDGRYDQRHFARWESRLHDTLAGLGVRR